MESLIEQVLSIRTPERQEQMSKLSKVILDSELSDDMEDLYRITELEDSSFDIINLFEQHIFKLLDELLRRMGIVADYNNLVNAPYKFVWLFEMIDIIEDYEDVDTLLFILDVDNKDISILNQLLELLIPDANSDFYDVILSIEKRTIDAILNNVLCAKKAASNESDYAVRGQRLLKFLYSKDNIPFFSVFENYTQYNTLEDVLANIDLSTLPVDYNINEETFSDIIIGTILCIAEDYEAATLLPTKVYDYFGEESQNVAMTLHGYKLINMELRGYYGGLSEGTYDE